MKLFGMLLLRSRRRLAMAKGLDYLQGSDKERLDDLVLAVVVLPAVAIGGLTAIALQREIGSLKDVIFTQQRVASGGIITIPKLRTIRRALSEGAPVGKPNSTFDARAGVMGNFVRRYGLDEIPQLLSVATGSMSFVGPRPLPEPHLERYEAADPALFREWDDVCALIPSGLCGLSQIMRRGRPEDSSPDILKRSMELDLEYAGSASVATDLKILAQTPVDLIVAGHRAAVAMAAPN